MTAEVFVLREIVAAERLVQRACLARYGGNTGPARRRGDALDVDERAQNRQRQIRMTGFHRLIEPVGKLALAGQRAMPLALVIGDAPDLPLRQFQLDQGQRGIGPGTGPDQMLDPCRFSALSQRGKPPADPVNDVGQKFGRRRVGVREAGRRARRAS